MRNGILGLFAFISLTLSAQAQGQIRSESIQTSPKPKVVDAFGLFYKPNDVATGVREFKPGDIVLSQPTRWAVSAQIEERASFGSDADANVIAPDTIMPLFLVSNLPGALEEQQVFCTVAKYQKRECRRAFLLCWQTRSTNRSMTAKTAFGTKMVTARPNLDFG
jgi:hypothetical protein